MHIVLCYRDDLQRLKESMQAEKEALQRDRLGAVLQAFEGEEAQAIAQTLGRARRFVQGLRIGSTGCGGTVGGRGLL